MSEQEQFQLPAMKETESTDRDKEQVTAALRATGARIDTLLEEHGNTEYHVPDAPEDRKPSVVGERSHVRVERTVNPDDGSKSYSVSYTETVVPPQPDGSKPNYNPYDFKVVDFGWQLDADGNPVEQSYSSADPYTAQTEENTVKGDLVLKGWGDERLYGVPDSATALSAMEDANTMVATADAEGKLSLHDASLASTAEQKTQEPTGRMARVRAFGRNLLNRN